MERPYSPAADPAAYAKGAGVDAPKALPPIAVLEPGKKTERTRGLRLFDLFLYPLFTNVGVFIISVGATYLTSRGKDHGRIGAFFQKRGDWLMEKFEATGMSNKQADMSKMVFFSFLDGSLLSPFVKMFEDRREKIGRWLDKKMGTVPADDGVYEAEPKHSWLSVLGGRAITAAIVVPTAVTLDTFRINGTKLNDKFFNNPGERVGGWIAKKPGLAKWFGKLDVKEVTRIGFFEAFYTSVCTVGLYFTSRRIARFVHRNDRPKEKPEALPVAAVASAPSDVPAPDGAARKIVRTAPQESFSETIAAERMAAKDSPNFIAAH